MSATRIESPAALREHVGRVLIRQSSVLLPLLMTDD
jgi:hypothetical protein